MQVDDKLNIALTVKYSNESALVLYLWLSIEDYLPTNPHWARVVGYGPFSLCVIHKEGLCPSSGDINGLMMM
jgi:hypothetical protein